MAEHRNLRQMKRWLRSEPESLAFNEVWADLIAAIASDSHGVAIVTGENFDIRIGGEENSIIIERVNETIEIPEDVFLTLWQQLRASGFLSGDYLPCGLSDYSDLIIPLMTKLPYICKVDMAEQSILSHHLAAGLRIVPEIGKHIRPELLLSPVGAVEPE